MFGTDHILRTVEAPLVFYFTVISMSFRPSFIRFIVSLIRETVLCLSLSVDYTLLCSSHPNRRNGAMISVREKATTILGLLSAARLTGLR